MLTGLPFRRALLILVPTCVILDCLFQSRALTYGFLLMLGFQIAFLILSMGIYFFIVDLLRWIRQCQKNGFPIPVVMAVIALMAGFIWLNMRPHSGTFTTNRDVAYVAYGWPFSMFAISRDRYIGGREFYMLLNLAHGLISIALTIIIGERFLKKRNGV